MRRHNGDFLYPWIIGLTAILVLFFASAPFHISIIRLFAPEPPAAIEVSFTPDARVPARARDSERWRRVSDSR